MIVELSNLTAQTLQPGQALTFNNVLHDDGCGVCFNKQAPTTAKLCKRGTYIVSFSGNITGAANDVLQIAIAIGGQPLIETGMNAVPAAAGNLTNVHTLTAVKNCCCDLDRLSVVNSGTTPVTIAPNSAFVIVGPV